MEDQFKEVEESFELLKDEYKQRIISKEEYIERLRRLRLKDGKGRYWMIGVKTGKWYYYDGKDWIQSDPPSFTEGKAICIHCGFENELTVEACASCGGTLGEKEENTCPVCGAKLKGRSCPRCNKELEELNDEWLDVEGRETNFIFQRINPLSFLLFWGAMGVFVGIIFGAFAGASEYFSGVVKVMPGFLLEFQGRLFGGIIFAVLGGVAGFLLFGALGYFEALFINVISSIVGGIKIRLRKR